MEHFGGEDHHRLVEIPVVLLVGQDLGFELHVRVDVVGVFWADTLVSEDDPAVLIRHLLCFFIQLLFF